MGPVARIAWGMGCGLLVATGFAAASALTQKVAAAEQASSFDVKPSWSSGTSRVQAGSPFVATLVPTTAKRCDVTIDGPQKGQLLRWTLQTSGTPIRLTLPTDRAATPGRWLVLASCVQRDDARQLTARMSLHLLGAGGRHLIGRHGALRKVVLTPHAQALVSSARHARVKVVAVVVKYGQSDLVGDDYPAAWRARRRDSVLDDWGNYNRESTSFVAWALASRNGFRMPFHSNAIAWAPLARERGYTVDRHSCAGFGRILGGRSRPCGLRPECQRQGRPGRGLQLVRPRRALRFADRSRLGVHLVHPLQGSGDCACSEPDLPGRDRAADHRGRGRRRLIAWFHDLAHHDLADDHHWDDDHHQWWWWWWWWWRRRRVECHL